MVDVSQIFDISWLDIKLTPEEKPPSPALKVKKLEEEKKKDNDKDFDSWSNNKVKAHNIQYQTKIKEF